MKKRILSLLCSLALLVTMMPVSAFAADASWAQSAVSALNEIYGSGVFSADDGLMSNADVQSVLSKTGWKTDVLLDDDEFTRSDACEVLADVFMLPLGNQSAIQYLYDKNIVSGTANGDLNADGSVSFAEFSVLSYRVLNTVGGGKGSAISGLKPGTDEYYGWLYLAVRKCVPFSAERGNEKIGQAENFTTYRSSQLKDGSTDIYEVNPDTVSGEAIWNAWENALQDPQIGGDTGFSATRYDENDTLLQAAGKIVKQFADHKYDGDLVIFHDVTAGDWFYDGIIYLADRQIVIGYGDGQFGPNDIAPRFQFAVLLSVMDGTVSGTDTSPERIPTAIDHVKEMGYMVAEVPDDATWDPVIDPIWSAATTREEAIVGILRMIESKYGINTKSNNTAILDRFADCADVSTENKPYLAFAVGMGLVNGTSANTLAPDAKVTRAQIGALLYRTLIGLDKTKMKDYADNVSATLQDSAAAASFSLPVQRAETAAANSKTLTLREDWRLSSDLDLAIPAGTTLTINGAGYHIYEMGGRLLNSGVGIVTFVNGTTLYPAGSVTEGVTVNGIWDSEESNALMATRQTGSSGSGSGSGGGSGSSGNRTETTTNPDGSTTTTVTRPDGSTTETTKNPDGSTEVVDTKKDGTVITTATDKNGNKTVVTENTDGTSETTITNTNGTTSTTKTDADGKTETVVKLPASVVTNASDKDETVELPMPEVTATSDSASAPIVTVDLPGGSTSAKVEIPVAGVTSGTVAVIVGEDGEETIVMNSIPTENGVVVTLADGDTIKVIDNSKHFADVPDSYWGADAVDFATSRELFNGTSETAFTPDGAMNRAMIVTVLARLEGVDTSTGDTWYDVGREWAMEAGISDGSNMDGTLTREQLATMLYRYAQSKGQGFTGAWAFQLDYPDADAVSDYAYEAMCWTTMHGIINGMGDGSLAPQGQATRAQVATMLMRFITTIA